MSIFSFIGYTQTELFRKPDNWRQIYKQAIRLFVHQTMGLKRVEKKKILRNDCLTTFKINTEAATWGVLYKTCSFKNFAIFTG